MSESAPLFRPQPFLRLIDQAMKMTRRHFRRIFLPVAVPVAIIATAWISVYMSWLLPLMNLEDPGAAFSPAGCGGIVVLTFLYMMSFWLSYAVLGAAAVDTVAGRPVDMGECWRYVFRPAVLGTLMVVLALFGFSFLFLVLPFLALYPLLAWTLPVMREERVYGFAAFGRASQLARHYPRGDLLRATYFKIFAIGVLGFVLAYAANLVVTLPFQVVQIPLQIRQLTADDPAAAQAAFRTSMWLSIPSSFLSSLAATAVALYTRFAQAMLYFDTRGRGRGDDLEAAIEDLHRRFAPEPSPAPPQAGLPTPGEPPAPGESPA